MVIFVGERITVSLAGSTALNCHHMIKQHLEKCFFPHAGVAMRPIYFMRPSPQSCRRASIQFFYVVWVRHWRILIIRHLRAGVTVSHDIIDQMWGYDRASPEAKPAFVISQIEAGQSDSQALGWGRNDRQAGSEGANGWDPPGLVNTCGDLPFPSVSLIQPGTP